MDKRKRLKRLPPKPVVFDLEASSFSGSQWMPEAFNLGTSLFSGSQWTPEEMDKLMKSTLARKSEGHASMFSISPQQFKNRMLRGNSAGRIIFDEITQSPTSYAEKYKLTAEEWRWAVAFNVHLGVNDKFYATKSSEDRCRIEQEYEALAKRNTVNGKRAAKVVAHRIAMVMNEEKPSRKHDDILDVLKYSSSPTGRLTGGKTNAQLAAYAALAEMMKEPKK